MRTEYVKKKVAKALEKLDAEWGSEDIETGHRNADKILCTFLNEMGFTEIVKAYNKIDKWYA